MRFTVVLGVAMYGVVHCHPNRLREKTASNVSGPLVGNSSDPGRSHVLVKTRYPIIQLINAYKTPIEFYGKVVDQHGTAVAGAAIKILPFDHAFGESDTEMDLTSDASGSFSIKGLKGLAIGVRVTKTGYLTFPDLGFEIF